MSGHRDPETDTIAKRCTGDEIMRKIQPITHKRTISRSNMKVSHDLDVKMNGCDTTPCQMPLWQRPPL